MRANKNRPPFCALVKHKGKAANIGHFRPFQDSRNPLDFQALNVAALARLPDLLAELLPDGKRQGSEYVAKNPCRADNKAGSFCVNLRTARWADFATSDAKGGDVVSLCAYLWSASQGEAAKRFAERLGVHHG